MGEWFPVIKGIQNQIVAIFFLCEYVGGEVSLSEEHDDYQWAGEAEAEKFDVMAPEGEVAKVCFACAHNQ